MIGTYDDAGTLSTWFVDEGEAFEGTLEVRVVDRAGNLSEPKQVSASGDEVGCTCSIAGAPSRNYSAFMGMGLTGLMLLVNRRRRRAVRSARWCRRLEPALRPQLVDPR